MLSEGELMTDCLPLICVLGIALLMAAIMIVIGVVMRWRAMPTPDEVDGDD